MTVLADGKPLANATVHGATITPLPAGEEQKQAELKVVLPAALNVSGKVTVGGKGLSGGNGELRVLAAFEGKGKLSQVLDVEVNAQASRSRLARN